MFSLCYFRCKVTLYIRCWLKVWARGRLGSWIPCYSHMDKQSQSPTSFTSTQLFHPCKLGYLGPLCTWVRGPSTCGIQIMWLLRRQRRSIFTFISNLEDMRDQRNLNGWKMWMVHDIIDGTKWIMFHHLLGDAPDPSRRDGSNAKP